MGTQLAQDPQSHAVRTTKRGVLASLLLSGLMLGCGSVDAAMDCHGICDRYASCYDSTYDVSACESRCRSSSSDDTDYRRSADTCNACLKERACVSATFSCGTECSTVVP